jgi:glycosyltransferase 2 family protein
MSRKSSALGYAIKALIAIAVSVLALAWSFHDVDLDRLLTDLGDTAPSKILLYALGQIVCHGIRIARWRLLLLPLWPKQGGSAWRETAAAASLGFPASFFLPFRLGELVRPVVIARAGVPFAGAMASVVVERLVDGLTNLGLFFLFLGLLPPSSPLPDELQRGARVAAIAFGGGVLVLGLAVAFRGVALAIVGRLLRPISPRVAERISGLMGTFIDGILALKSPARILGFLALTLSYWSLNGLSTWWLATSYSPGLPVLAGPFAITVVVFAITIPAGPAFAGTLEAGFKAGLGAFGVPATTAVVIAVAVHATTIVLLAGFAGAAFLLMNPSERRNLRALGAEPKIDPPG